MGARKIRQFIGLFLVVGEFSGGIGGIRGCPTISGVICIDFDTFALCNTDGYLTNSRYNCAVGSVCSESSTEICKPLYKEPPPLCDKNCGKCSKTRKFACVGRNKFALCLNGMYPTGMIYTCPDNYICSTSNSKNMFQNTNNQAAEFCHDEKLVAKKDCC